MTDFQRLVDALAEQSVDYVVIGGIALVTHGYSRLTEDLDLCYRRTPENMQRLAAALAPLKPTLRGAPPGLPFTLDARTLKGGLNFTLETIAGDIDLLGEVAGVGPYEALSADAIDVELYGQRVRVMSLDALERSKRAAGRAKDLADLEAIRALKRRG